MQSKITEILNIKYPIFQGAMAWVSESSLASAVSNAGGLGIIASGNAPAEVIREEIIKTKKLTNKPFGVNIMLLSPFADDVVKVVLEEGVPVVTTGAGNPSKYMEAFKEKGIKVIPVVPSVAIAKKMEKIGADALIAEGMEAGGHIGKLTTMAMLPQIIEAVSIPVIAAGGIASGKAMAATFMFGAEGVQIGTRFLVANECITHEKYKQFVIKAKDIDSVITGQKTGHPVRVLRNALTRSFEQLEASITDQEEYIKKFEELGSGSLKNAVVDGDIENGSVMAGQIAGLVKKEQSCVEIIEEIVNEFYEALETSSKKWVK